MNVTTIGFPFGPLPGAPVPAGPEQGFALALDAARGFGAVPVSNGGGTVPLLPTDAATPAAAEAASQDGGPLVRPQPGAPITLSQLLTTASKLPVATIAEVRPEPVAAPQTAVPQAGIATPIPDPHVPIDAAAPTNPVDMPAPDAAPIDPTEPNAAPSAPASLVKAGPTAPVGSPVAPDEKPLPLDTPVAEAVVATAPVAVPVKTRKPVAAAPDAPAPQGDPPVMPVVAMTVPVAAAPAPIQAPTSQRKTDTGQAARPIPIIANDAGIPASNDAAPALPAGKAAPEAADTATDGMPFGEPSPRGDARPAGAPPAHQNFASHVAQSEAARAPAHAAVPPEPVVAARPGQLGRELGVEIARKVGAGEDTLRVRLNPAELGRIEVTLAFDDNGSLRATMRTESRHALELLRQDAPDLSRALDSAGVRADAQSFRFESRAGDGGGQSSHQPQQQSRGGRQSFHDEPEVPAPVHRAIRADGQVDLIA